MGKKVPMRAMIIRYDNETKEEKELKRKKCQSMEKKEPRIGLYGASIDEDGCLRRPAAMLSMNKGGVGMLRKSGGKTNSTKAMWQVVKRGSP